MGFLGNPKKPDQNNDLGDEKKYRKNKDKQDYKENLDEAPRNTGKEKGTLKEKISSHSFRHIMEIGKLLKILGDDLQRQALQNRQKNANNQENVKYKKNITRNKRNNNKPGSSV